MYEASAGMKMREGREEGRSGEVHEGERKKVHARHIKDGWQHTQAPPPPWPPPPALPLLIPTQLKCAHVHVFSSLCASSSSFV